jgi:hypothetical protein
MFAPCGRFTQPHSLMCFLFEAPGFCVPSLYPNVAYIFGCKSFEGAKRFCAENLYHVRVYALPKTKSASSADKSGFGSNERAENIGRGRVKVSGGGCFRQGEGSLGPVAVILSRDG